MATVWARLDVWAGSSFLDRIEVGGITPTLATRSRVEGNAQRLQANRDRSFQGTVVLGMGFVLSKIEAEEMVAADARNVDVVRPYLTGEDLNQRPDGSPSRSVIDFGEWAAERARQYALPFDRLKRLVLPERSQKDPQKYPRMVHEWWKFWNGRPGLYRAVKPLDSCIVIARVSKTVQPMLAPAGAVFADVIVVFAYDDDGHFGLLTSGFHWWWTVTHASTMRTDIRYTPTDCFETFAQPDLKNSAALVFGMVIGALWLLVPTLLRVFLAIDEVVTTLMLNYIGIAL